MQTMFQFSVDENAGHRGGWTVRSPDPSPEELERLKALIRASRKDPELRARLRLPPVDIQH